MTPSAVHELAMTVQEVVEELEKGASLAKATAAAAYERARLQKQLSLDGKVVLGRG